ncbi:hypothetical protein J6590_018817 [Homalodisca vitripennis]|nr:hypothetical protein J6590_018817 [Homalodisca vitripennis]
MTYFTNQFRAKKPSLRPEDHRHKGHIRHQRPGRQPACKDRITQRSPIQAAATLDGSPFGSARWCMGIISSTMDER